MAFGSLKLNFEPIFFSDLGLSLPKEVFYSRDRSFFPLKTQPIPKNHEKHKKCSFGALQIADGDRNIVLSPFLTI